MGHRGWPHFSGMKGQSQCWHASYRWLCLSLEKLPRSSLLGSPQGNGKEGCARACPRIIPGKPTGWSCWRRQRGTLDRVSGALCPRPHRWVFADGIQGDPARGWAAGTWFCSVLRGARPRGCALPPPDGTCYAEPHGRPAPPARPFQRGEWATPHLGRPRTWQKCHTCHALHSQTGGVAVRGPLSPCFPSFSLSADAILPSNSCWDTRPPEPWEPARQPTGASWTPWGAS